MNTNTKIIVVEDDETTALNLKISLQKHQYDVVAIYHDATQASSAISIHKPDIVLIDISLQEENDGIVLARTIKTEYDLPFIYLTSYNDDETITYAKFTEPYGYIIKPFDPDSLHAVIQMALFKYQQDSEKNKSIMSLKHEKLNLMTRLRSKRSSNKTIVPFSKDYYVDMKTHEIFYKDKKLKLTKKENNFLRILVENIGHVISFEQAINHIWEEQGATQNSVRTLVWRLRDKLKSDIIKNASGMGYYIES